MAIKKRLKKRLCVVHESGLDVRGGVFMRLDGTRRGIGTQYECEHAVSAARYYGFTATAERIGDVQLTAERMAKAMRPWADAVLAILNDDCEGPIFALARKKSSNWRDISD